MTATALRTGSVPAHRTFVPLHAVIPDSERSRMERRRLGMTGMHVSILGFGGAEIGYGHAPQATVDQLVGEALDAGLNVIDTAECYFTSEALLGHAVAHRRQEVYLLTKCGHAAGFALPDWHPRLLSQSIERSLQRLRTDYVDVVQLHSCSTAVLQQGEVIEVLQRAREAGKTRYLGYSGDGAAARSAVECGAFDTLQTSINIADQEALELTVPLATAGGMGVIAKRPVANVAWKYHQRPADPYVQPYWERLRQLDYAFLRQPLGDAVGIALRFTLSLEGVHTAIVGSTQPGRWQQNAGHLATGPLPPEQWAGMRARWKAIAGPGWTGEV
jgi:aryl-alcohol dehydrogenase-like predicted oxidoreductase